MIRRVVQASLAAIALLALLAGVPMLLVIYGRSPLDGHGSVVEQLTSLPTQAISDHMAFGLLTLAAWVAWATFGHTVVIELANTFGPATRRRPLGWSPFQMTARHLVTALTMTASLSTSLGARAGSIPALGAAAAADEIAPAPSDMQGAAARQTEPSRHPPTLILNELDRSSSNLLGTADRDEQAEPLFPAAAVPAAPSETPSDAPLVTVAPGDSPWALAEQHLGSGVRWRELWDLNRGIVQPDGRAWVTEDLIRPGWQLRLPTPPVEVSPSPPTDEATSATTEELVPSVACLPEDNAPQADSEPATSAASEDETPAPTSPSTTSAPAEQNEREARADNSVDDSVPEDGGSFQPDLAPTVAGITGATVLATSLALLVRRLRRRRATRTARHWAQRRGPRTSAVEHAIAAAADVPLVRWAGQELADVMRRTDPETLGGVAPVAVELSEERGIDLLWDKPAPHPPEPWIRMDEGWAWSLPYDPDAPVPPDERTSPIPALLTVGDREGRQLMIDIEAFGSISVTGDPNRVSDFGRAVALELGANDDLADAYVSILGFGVGADDYLRRARTVSRPDALEQLRTTVNAVAGALDQTTHPSTFSYRMAGDDSYLEATVVLANIKNESADDIAALVDASPSRRGVATILLGGVPAAKAQVIIETDGTATIEPLGVTFRAAGVSASTEQELSNLFAEAANVSGSADETGTVDDLHRSPTYSNGSEPTAGRDADIDEAPAVLIHLPDAIAESDQVDEDPGRSEPSLLVKVLGAPLVPDRPTLRRRELLVTVYMACRGCAVTPSNIQNAVWGGRAVEPKTLWNVVARTRSTLGSFDDGTPVLPPTDRRSGTLRLSELVVTDLALLQACFSHALQLPSYDAIKLLRRGLALVEGEPFNASGYEWAFRDEQFVAEAATLIENAVELLVQLATEAGENDVAREAIKQGLRGLPGNEVLYRTRMRLEHSVGNIAGVEAAWNELSDFLLDLEIDPSDSTVALHSQLTRSR